MIVDNCSFRIMNKRYAAASILLLVSLLIAACSSAPEVLVVEITRIVPEIEQVEVTRLVEVEKEVTRVVQAPYDPSAAPGLPIPAADIEFLQIDFWPDFDRPAVLVLLTGRLPAAIPLPADVALPIPADAQINAVAQIDDTGMSSIDYTIVDGAVLFQSPTPAFRVEYYVPYQRDQNRRFYEFQWLAPFSVYELAVQVQRPANTADLAIDPQPSVSFTDDADGLDYYQLNSLSVPRGIPYNLNFSYTMPSDALTIDELSPTSPDLPNAPLHNNQQASAQLINN
jgi:hypothetical protein